MEAEQWSAAAGSNQDFCSLSCALTQRMTFWANIIAHAASGRAAQCEEATRTWKTDALWARWLPNPGPGDTATMSCCSGDGEEATVFKKYIYINNKVWKVATAEMERSGAIRAACIVGQVWLLMLDTVRKTILIGKKKTNKPKYAVEDWPCFI